MNVWVAGGLSGALVALALPPFPLWPLVFVGLAPLAWVLRDPELSRNEVAGAGLAFGAVQCGLLLHWVPITLHGILPLGAFSGALFLGILTGVGGAQAVLLHRLLALRGLPATLALPAVFVGTEFLLAHAGPLAIPWLPLGLALTSVPEVAGPAEWVGVGGLGLWIALVNGGAVEAARIALGPSPRSGLRGFTLRRRSGMRGSGLRSSAVRGSGPLGSGAGIFLFMLLSTAPGVWGVWRAGRLPLESLPPVVLVQLAIPRSELADPIARDVAAAASMERVLGALGTEGAGLPTSGGEALAPAFVLLPEAPFAGSWTDGSRLRFTGHAQALGLPILVGTFLLPGELPSPDLGRGRRNAVLRVEAGTPSELVHAKVRLVPGVERPGIRAGPGGGVVEVGGIRLGALICFESAFGSLGRRLRAEGAQLLVNPSNDGWFRAGPGSAGTGSGGAAALAQHRAHLVLRTIESRMGAVRSSVGGEILAIDPVGRVHESRPPGGEGAVSVRPLTTPGSTVAVRVGDLGGAAGVLLLVGLFLPWDRLRRRGRHNTGRGGEATPARGAP